VQLARKSSSLAQAAVSERFTSQIRFALPNLSNLSQAIALSWAQAGAAGIIITGRAVKDLEAVAAELRETSPKTDVVALTADVTSEDAIVELYAKSKARFGIIDVLICNAGVFNGGKTDFPIIGTMDPKRWWFDLVRHSAVFTAR
jgi:NAD(P)-dependent dehydrogenase (short-subunit alcohol dehydrogenase family)